MTPDGLSVLTRAAESWLGLLKAFPPSALRKMGADPAHIPALELAIAEAREELELQENPRP